MTLRTQAYRFTVTDRFDPKVLDLKEQVKADNRAKVKADPEEAVTQRVVLRGRLGKDNPYAVHYRLGGKHYRSSSKTIRPEHASHFDVYVHDVPAYSRHARRDGYVLPETQHHVDGRFTSFSDFVSRQLLSFMEYVDLKGAELGLDQTEIDFIVRKKAAILL